MCVLARRRALQLLNTRTQCSCWPLAQRVKLHKYRKARYFHGTLLFFLGLLLLMAFVGRLGSQVGRCQHHPGSGKNPLARFTSECPSIKIAPCYQLATFPLLSPVSVELARRCRRGGSSIGPPEIQIESLRLWWEGEGKEETELLP